MTFLNNIAEQKLQAVFATHHILLYLREDYVIAHTPQNDTEEKIQQIVEAIGFCPLISTIKTARTFIFSIVPYKIPSFFFDMNGESSLQQREDLLVSKMKASPLQRPLLSSIPNLLAPPNLSTLIHHRQRDNLELKIAREDLEIREWHQLHCLGDYANHISNSRTLMERGARRLPEHGRIVVLGGGLIEPWKQLYASCQELLLVDCDLATLQAVAAHLPREKVTSLQMDLSGGVCAEADHFVENAFRQQYSPEKFLAEMHLFYNRASPKELDFNGIFNNADYVVSSLVASQLSINVIRYFDWAFNQLFTFSLESYLNSKNSAIIQESIKYRNRFMDKLFNKHIADLSHLARAEATVYFADTTSKPTEDLSIISSDSIAHLSQYFAIEEQQKWLWYYQTRQSPPYCVEAFLMRKSFTPTKLLRAEGSSSS